MELSYTVTADSFSQHTRILPSSNENPDMLHNIAVQLPPITHPGVIFSNEALQHKYDSLSDEEYDFQLYMCKKLGELWENPATGKGLHSISIFELLTRLLDTNIEKIRLEYYSESSRREN